MLSPDLRRKLSRLNLERGPVDDAPAVERASETDQTVTLEQVLPGRVEEHALGRLYVCERRVETLYPSGMDRLHAGVKEVRNHGYKPDEVLFLDIETCGLANCPLFLVGTMSVRDGDLRIEQFFARDYSEEAGLLAYVGEAMAGFGMLITFNGKTFDVPYMRDRMVLHRIPCDMAHDHLDLLQIARRLWRNQLPNCRLQTLEEHICGRRRVGDTPGHLIPQLYHDFVHTGNAAPLDGIFHHNCLDLITMAELLPAMRGEGESS